MLNSDDSKFGGYDRLDNETKHFSHKDPDGKEVLKLYIPSLSAFVLERS
ncbi:MAG: alpha amylase C-terminal domain-containing protein [Bacteroidota bacterium]